MPRWLVEDPTVVYLVLCIAALALAVGWWMSPYEDARDRARRQPKPRRLTRKWLFFLGLAVVAVLFAGVWMLSRFVDTDSKQLVRNIQDMADGVVARDPDRVFKHISDDFRYQGLTKSAFRAVAERHIRGGEVEEIKLDEFEPVNVSREKGTGAVKFWVKAKGRNIFNDAGYRCLATFGLDKDGHWRLKGLKFTQPQVNPEVGEEISLPLQ